MVVPLCWEVKQVTGVPDRWGSLDPPQAVVPPRAGWPRMVELVGRVVAALGPVEDEVYSDRWGDQDVLRLRRLIVFDRSGQPTEHRGYIIYQSRLRKAISGRPVTIGRIIRPEQAYELETIGSVLRDRAAQVLIDEGWMLDDGRLPADGPHPAAASASERVVDEGWHYDDKSF